MDKGMDRAPSGRNGTVSGGLAVVEHKPTLTELAATVEREHELTVRAAGAALEHALRAGEALLTAEEVCRSAYEWERWRRENVGLSRGVARSYMRLAEYRELVLQGLERPTLSGALQYLSSLSLPRLNQHSDETREEALRLREGGMPRHEVAKLLGVGEMTVQLWDDPKYAASRRAASKEKARQAREAKAAESRERRDAAARKAGGAGAEAYSHLRRAAQALERAQRETDDKDARQAFSKALAKLYPAEDELVRGLKVT